MTCYFLFAVLYVDRPLSCTYYFGHLGWMDFDVVFGLRREFPIVQAGSMERSMTIYRMEHSHLRAMITDVDFTVSTSCDHIEKPAFFFGDHIAADDDMICADDPETNSRFPFLPIMKRMYPLSYFQSLSCGRRLDWDLVEEKNKVVIGILTQNRIHSMGHNYHVRGLKPGEFHRVDSSQERTVPANIFIRQFIAARGEFPSQEFRAPGWLYSSDEGWWVRMVDFILTKLRTPLILSGLEIPVTAMRHGIIQSSYNFFAILEKYNSDTCTFFTPVGELGFALHEMYAVSGLPFGELPYEEFIPGADELFILQKVYPEIHATFWEVMGHFHKCAQVTGIRSGGVKHASWAEYLFQNLHNKDATVTRLSPSSSKGVEETSISDMALFAGFLMIWLKRCVVPSKPIESILAEVVYPAVLLAHGKPISLLSAMVSCLQYGLRELTSELLDVREIGPQGDKLLKTCQPRVPVPYTYLVAWFVMHCPSLMTGVDDASFNVPFVQQFKSAKWVHSYIVPTRQVLLEENNYEVYCCFPDFDRAREQGQPFYDMALGNFTHLPEGIFRWLITIRPGYLIFRLGARCIIEPYLPSRFARQFGYDQLYIGNPNLKLASVGNLYEGARAWYYWTSGNSRAAFTLPSPTPNCYATHGFCSWFREAARVPEYDVYKSCLKDIREMYESRKNSKSTRLRGMDEYLASEQEAQTGPVQIEAPEEPLQIEAPREKEADKRALPTEERVAGKRALTAEETAQYEKRARSRIATRSHSQPKLLQASMKAEASEKKKAGMKTSAKEKSSEKKDVQRITRSHSQPGPHAEKEIPSDEPIFPSPALNLSAEEKQGIIDTEQSTIPQSFYLGFYIKQLEGTLRFAVDHALKGRGSFYDYKTLVQKGLRDIELSGGTKWFKYCSERVRLLEADIQTFQDLERVDIDEEIAKSLKIIQATKASQAGLSEKKARVATLQEQHDQVDTKLVRSVTTTKEAIILLEKELAQKRAQLAQAQEAVESHRRRGAEALEGLQQEIRALEETAMVDTRSETEIAEKMRAEHDQKLADLKLRLTVIYMTEP